VQPAKLQSYLTDAVTGGFADDGLAQRLQVTVWPDVKPQWRHIDRAADIKAGTAVEEILRRIAAMPEDSLRLRFDGDAQMLFNDWRTDLEGRLRRGTLPPVLESHLSKYRSLMPSIALLLHLAASAPGTEVSLEQAQRAAMWCEYLESHARRVYSCVTSYQQRLAASLGLKLRGGSLAVKFHARDVYMKGWADLDTREKAQIALDILLDAGWIRRVHIGAGPRGGRPTDEYVVNPAVRRG
jgi:hypothetical protein